MSWFSDLRSALGLGRPASEGPRHAKRRALTPQQKEEEARDDYLRAYSDGLAAYRGMSRRELGQTEKELVGALAKKRANRPTLQGSYDAVKEAIRRKRNKST